MIFGVSRRGELCEISQTFGEIHLSHFAKQRNLHTTKLCYFVNFMFCIKHNFYWSILNIQKFLVFGNGFSSNNNRDKFLYMTYLFYFQSCSMYRCITSTLCGIDVEFREHVPKKNQLKCPLKALIHYEMHFVLGVGIC